MKKKAKTKECSNCMFHLKVCKELPEGGCNRFEPKLDLSGEIPFLFLKALVLLLLLASFLFIMGNIIPQFHTAW